MGRGGSADLSPWYLRCLRCVVRPEHSSSCAILQPTQEIRMTIAGHGRGRAGMVGSGVRGKCACMGADLTTAAQHRPMSPPFMPSPSVRASNKHTTRPTSSHCDSVGRVGRGCMRTLSCIHHLTFSPHSEYVPSSVKGQLLTGRGITACTFTVAHSEMGGWANVWGSAPTL